MIFQEMTPQIWLLEQSLWWLGCVIAIGLGIFFIIRMKKSEVSSKFMLGLAIFSFTYGAARIIENIRKYIVSGYDNRTDIFDAWVSGSQISGLNYWLRIAYYVIAWAGIAMFYYSSEKYVFRGKTKYAMTIISVVEGIVSILSYIPEDGPTLITTFAAAIGFFIATIFPIVLYARMAARNTGVLRKNCIVVAMGLAVFVFSVMCDLPESTYIVHLVGGIPLAVWITSILAPISLFIGMLIMTLGFSRMFSDLL